MLAPIKRSASNPPERHQTAGGGGAPQEPAQRPELPGWEPQRLEIGQAAAVEHAVAGAWRGCGVRTRLAQEGAPAAARVGSRGPHMQIRLQPVLRRTGTAPEETGTHTNSCGPYALSAGHDIQDMRTNLRVLNG